jgi:GH18 family chitinase
MNLRPYFLVVIAILILIMNGCKLGKTESETETDNENEETGMWVIVYHPMYQWPQVSADQVPWDHVTHLSLGYLWPVESNSEYTIGLQPNSWWTGGWGGMTRWRGEAEVFIQKAPPGKKILCHLGGAGSNPNGQWTTATSANNIRKFAENIKEVLTSLGFDGVDLNWEDDVVFTNLVNLAKELRGLWPDAIITIPTGMVGSDADDLAGAKDAVDVFLPMTYIPVSGWWGGWSIPAPLTPLYGADDNINDIDHVLNQWIKAGVPASKMLMGVGGFGSVWGDGGGVYDNGIGPIAPYVNGGTGPAEDERISLRGDNFVTWAWVKKTTEANPNTLIKAWDDIGKCSYWHALSKNQLVYVDGLEISLIFYETEQSINEKVKFINEKGMKGMGFWTLSQMMDTDGACPILETAKPKINSYKGI